MPSDSIDNEGEVPHYAYLVFRLFPPFPTKIAVLCHHAKTNEIFLPGERAGPSPSTRMKSIELFLVETLVLQIEFRLPFDLFNTLYLYWEQAVTTNYHGIKYYLYVADVIFRDFIDSFRNVGGAQAIVANFKFQEE